MSSPPVRAVLMFGFIEGVIRYVRVTGYALTLVTDRYPPFPLAT